MKTIALYNIKGGVGKTATAVNLAYLCAQEGYSTLLWDLDPQGAASFYYRIKSKLKGGADRLVENKDSLTAAIKATDYPLLEMIPADFSLRNLDLLLEGRKKPTKRLRKLLEPLEQQYDYVFIDCAPSISLVSESVFLASDALLIPTIPTTLSLRTLQQIHRYFDDNALDTATLLPFFSMVDSRRQMHRIMVEHPPQKPVPFLQAHIPYLSEIERMGTERKPASAAGSSRSAKAYLALWHELKARLTG